MVAPKLPTSRRFRIPYIAVLFLFIFSIIVQLSLLSNENDRGFGGVLPEVTFPRPSVSSAPPVPELHDENVFQALQKNCTVSKCKVYVPESGIQKIVLIAPPGEKATSVFKLMKGFESSSHVIKLQSSVPSYGYGATHGLSRIIRILPRSLVEEVVGAIQGVVQPGGETSSSYESLYAQMSLKDTKAVLRQILRFHDRLSKVAAHTSLLTIRETDILQRPGEVARALLDFVHGKDAADKKDSLPATLFEHYRQPPANSFLAFLARNSSVSVVLDELNYVLLNELKFTKNMTVWPSPSFWLSGEEDDRKDLSEIPRALAKLFSPDCSDPSVNCWVKRDKCEAVGDALCL